MKKYIIPILFSVFVLTACAQKSNVPTISTQDFVSKVKNDSSLVILDVRTPQELAGPLGQINGVINIPVQQLDKRIDELKKNKNKTIYVICRSGNRSTTGTKILRENGYDAYNVSGGMREYRKEVGAKN